MDFEKIAVALQQRIGDQAARYEADLAVQKVQYESAIESLKARIDELESPAAEAEPEVLLD